jgi:hypothetical protein
MAGNSSLRSGSNTELFLPMEGLEVQAWLLPLQGYAIKAVQITCLKGIRVFY